MRRVNVIDKVRKVSPMPQCGSAVAFLNEKFTPNEENHRIWTIETNERS